MSLPLEPTGLPAREEMGNVSRPAEGMEPDPLLGSQKTQMEQNGVTCVGTTPAQSGSRRPTGAAGWLAGLRRWARRWAVPNLVLNFVLILLLLLLIFITILMAQPAPAQTCELCLAGAPCPDDWIEYRGKCYYFSETEANWIDSQKNCSALGASLAGIDSQLEMDFMKRYKYLNSRFWIGLRREPGQPWKWANGTEFNDWFPIAGGEHCVFLNDGNMASSSCSGRTHWICSKLAQKAEGGAN